MAERASRRLRQAVVAAAAVACIGPLALARPAPAAATGPDRSVVGEFAVPFQEPASQCQKPDPKQADNGICPTAASIVVLNDGRLLYWNGLEGTENAQSGAGDFGAIAPDDQSRVLTLGDEGPAWRIPVNPTGGASNSGYTSAYPAPITPLIPVKRAPGSGALFCADQVQLADGRILAAGGSEYYEEPNVPGTNDGSIELEGIKNSRIFDPETNTWNQAAGMNFGRWYPSMVTLPDGRIFVASGVTKLIKPMYPNQPPTDSGRNVVHSETYDPQANTWAINGAGGKLDSSGAASGDRSLPLFPRLHLLPNGDVYYDGGGQVFNPFGQAYDEATWNIDAVYDPNALSWTNLGIPGIGTPTPGFRGSTFSIALPLAPPYTKESFLVAGGTLGTTPGSYVANSFSQINTVDTTKIAGDPSNAVTSTATGNLNNARWYTTGVGLPDGSVFAVSGADTDEVIGPGFEHAVHQAEIFDPATGQWTAVASESKDRTYHNTAVLLPDGRVLVGGHAPIPTGYGPQGTVPGGFANNSRDPSFEIYRPPYLFKGPRPVIHQVDGPVGYGGAFGVDTDQASSITKVLLVRNPALTHLVDGDQRTVELPILARTDGHLVVAEPPNSAVAPPGPYMLFIDRASGGSLIPSEAAQVSVGVHDGVPVHVQASVSATVSGGPVRSSGAGQSGVGSAPASAASAGGAAAAAGAGSTATAPRTAAVTGADATRAAALGGATPAGARGGGPPALPVGVAVAGLLIGAALIRRRARRSS